MRDNKSVCPPQGEGQREIRREGSYSMIAENDEKKRSKLWRIAMTVSSVLIIIIAVFFGIRLFTSNPLEGKWINEGSGLVMRIQGNGTASLEWPDDTSAESGFAAETMEGTYDYSLEQGELTLTEREYGDQMVFEKE